MGRGGLARYGRVSVTESAPDTFLSGEPALYREVNLGGPRVPIGAIWAYWWTGVVGDRAVAVAVEGESSDAAETHRTVPRRLHPDPVSEWRTTKTSHERCRTRR